jgi:hypothetical protein
MINEQELALKHSNKLNQKYQKNSVTIMGLKPIIMLLNRGFNPCVEAKIQAVIMGAIADSSTATWITFECC